MQLVEVRLCLTVRQSLTSIVSAFPIPAGIITSFGCPHILLYKTTNAGAWEPGGYCGGLFSTYGLNRSFLAAKMVLIIFHGTSNHFMCFFTPINIRYFANTLFTGKMLVSQKIMFKAINIRLRTI